jgi:hypothetical protein
MARSDRRRTARGVARAARFAIAAVAFAVAFAGYAMAKKRYGAARAAEWQARERTIPLYGAIRGALRLDAVYDATVVAAARRLARVVADVDRWVIEPLAGFSGLAAKLATRFGESVDAEPSVEGAAAVPGRRAPTYVYAVAGAVVALLVLRWMLGR